ncbi:hypothetical protein NX059_007658 [Plenodomus lindquistii]|nr:hypothetical protein NX059_007658 [Plenodomus lindquistii]
MHLIIALCATIVAPAISAAATPASREAFPLVTVSIANDLTGANAAVTVFSDGLARNLIDLFSNTTIDQHGVIFGTSVQLIKFTPKTHCFFQNYNDIIQFGGEDKTYVDLDGNTGKATPVNLNGFNLQCAER